MVLSYQARLRADAKGPLTLSIGRYCSLNTVCAQQLEALGDESLRQTDHTD
jgi:hypothetical protein